jgi:multidrug efflux pump subunit AcrB
VVCGIFIVFCAVSFALFPFLGRDFFHQSMPASLACTCGRQRAHAGSDRAALFEGGRNNRETIPSDELKTVLDNIGLPPFLNLAFGSTATIGPADGDILVALQPRHGPTQKYVEALRNKLTVRFPDMIFFFQPADIVTQVLNFGLPAPIDIQVVGHDPKNQDIAREIRKRVAAIPGAIDVHLAQVLDSPELFVNVDRTWPRSSA